MLDTDYRVCPMMLGDGDEPSICEGTIAVDGVCESCGSIWPPESWGLLDGWG